MNFPLSISQTEVDDTQIGLISLAKSLEKQLEIYGSAGQDTIQSLDLEHRHQLLKSQRERIEQELRMVEEKLHVHRNYCHLIAETIRECELDSKATTDSEREVCRSFLNFLEEQTI